VFINQLYRKQPVAPQPLPVGITATPLSLIESSH
jgi:hypothetical protein